MKKELSDKLKNNFLEITTNDIYKLQKSISNNKNKGISLQYIDSDGKKGYTKIVTREVFRICFRQL